MIHLLKILVVMSLKIRKFENAIKLVREENYERLMMKKIK